MRNFYLFTVYFFAAACLFADSYQVHILPSDGEGSVHATSISSGKIAGFSRTHDLSLGATALLWQTPGSSPQSFHPAGDTWFGSKISSAHGTTLGGGVSTLVTYPHHLRPDVMVRSQRFQAVTWDSTSGSITHLHPDGFDTSYVNGCWENQQAGNVGTASADGFTRLNAAFWSGTSGSFVNLNPEGYVGSNARAIWGNQQVGAAGLPADGSLPFNSRSHAMLWHGTASSAIDLHPATFTSSEAFGAWNGRQVGMGSLDPSGAISILSVTHALLWSGSAETCVDLHPDEFYSSKALAICGDLQVGYGMLNISLDSSRALLWSGTAESVINLHDLLPSIYDYSEAHGVDEFGNIVGTAYIGRTAHAIYWQVVPEPTSCLLLAAGAMLLGRRRRP